MLKEFIPAIEWLEGNGGDYDDHLYGLGLDAHVHVFARPMFEVLKDDDVEEIHDDNDCHCFGYVPTCPLESVPWTEEVENSWLKRGRKPFFSPYELHAKWFNENGYRNTLII